MAQTAERWTLRAAWAPGIAAVRAHWGPILLIQAVAVTLAVAYFIRADLRAAAEIVSDLREQAGVLGAFLTGVMAGGLMPEVAKAITGRPGRWDCARVEKVAFTSFVYGTIGVTVTLFYLVQNAIFGTAVADVRTTLLKTAFDLLVFAPFVSMPLAMALFTFYRERYRLSAWRLILSRGWYRDEVVPALLLCWVFWGPILLCTYALPVGLQFPFSMLMQAAWSILFVFLAMRPAESIEPTAAPTS